MHMTHTQTGMSRSILVLAARIVAIGLLFVGSFYLGKAQTPTTDSKEKITMREWIEDREPLYRKETWEQRATRMINANLKAIDRAGGVTKIRDRQIECLAKNIYFESRGEPLAGQVAVAMVTLNRLEQGYERTICGVVKQKKVADVCQFSWVCEGDKARPSGYDWRLAVGIAVTALQDSEHIQDPTGGATHFHATYVRPDWSRSYQKVAKIGDHIFYKPNKNY